jgi:hypothetical protein
MAHVRLEAVIPQCETLIGYHFKNPSLLARALNGSGNLVLFNERFIESNKPLAIYGDIMAAARLARKWLDKNLTLSQ